MFIDISLTSAGIYISSFAFSLLYPVTAPTILVYSVILSLCITRINSTFMIIATLYTIISYNIVYFLWYRIFSSSIEYTLMMLLGYAHREQFIKSIFIIILGTISYYTTITMKKFVNNTIEASIKAKNAELRLINQYKNILNNLNIGITIIDINATVIFINQTLVTLLGYNKNDIIGKNLFELIISERKNKNQNLFKLIENKLKKNKFLQLKLSLTAKNGEIIPVQIYISKTYILGDPSYLLTISDLRKQKALEDRLLQSKKMETIGRMASGFAHDFNNLISIANEYIYEALKNKKSIDNMIIDKIHSVINRQKDLVELLYKISGKMEESKVELSIKRLFPKIISLLSSILPDNISLSMKSYIEENTVFTVNETAILQIIFNLILNAKEAIEPASGNIEVSASITNEYDKSNAVLLPKTHKHQKYLILIVSDNGPGISKNILNRIFDPYVSTKSNKNSMRRGLGLSFVYAITEQINGGISIFTKKGEGTTFKIYIPTEISNSDVTEEIVDKEKSNGEIELEDENYLNTGQKVKILYIDDDEDMRVITTKILNRHGFFVKAARNGIDALKFLENDNFNLILTDFYLPDIEGDKLVLKLRELCSTPIILITGDQSENIRDIKEVNAIIKKPIEVDSLLKTIYEIVNH